MNSSAGTVSVANRWVVFSHGLFFVGGFSLIFVILGVGVGAIGTLRTGIIQTNDIITLVGGILITVLGLHTAGVIRIPFLYYDTRNQQAPRRELGYSGSFLMGVSFAAGWTPCVGPILGSILTLGFAAGYTVQTIYLLIAYSLGLAIPFLLAAFLMEQISGWLRGMRRYMSIIEWISGGLLIAIGIALMVGPLQRMLDIYIIRTSAQAILATLFGGTDLAITVESALGLDSVAVTAPIAFLAGLISFLSPCVLPLVPAYVGYLTGQATATAADDLLEQESVLTQVANPGDGLSTSPTPTNN